MCVFADEDDCLPWAVIVCCLYTCMRMLETSRWVMVQNNLVSPPPCPEELRQTLKYIISNICRRRGLPVAEDSPFTTKYLLPLGDGEERGLSSFCSSEQKTTIIDGGWPLHANNDLRISKVLVSLCPRLSHQQLASDCCCCRKCK